MCPRAAPKLSLLEAALKARGNVGGSLCRFKASLSTSRKGFDLGRWCLGSRSSLVLVEVLQTCFLSDSYTPSPPSAHPRYPCTVYTGSVHSLSFSHTPTCCTLPALMNSIPVSLHK